MKRAMIFFACRDKYYFRIARYCAGNAKRWMPDVDTVLLTERTDWTRGPFDRIVLVPKPPQVARSFPPLLHLPEEYDSGIYVGAKITCLVPMYDVYELVEGPRADVALCFTTGKPHDTQYPSPGIPDAFPHFRSVFAFQHHGRTREFFALWRDEWDKERMEYAHLRHQPSHQEQSSMRKALYHSDLSMVTLRANFMATLSWEVLRGTVRMIAIPKKWDPRPLVAEANRLAPDRRLFTSGKSTLRKE